MKRFYLLIGVISMFAIATSALARENLGKFKKDVPPLTIEYKAPEPAPIVIKATTVVQDASVPTPTPFDYSTVYDLNSKKFIAAVTYRLGDLEDFLGIKGLTVEVRGFGGGSVAAQGAGLVAGGLLAVHTPIGKTLKATLGVGFMSGTTSKMSGVVFLGITGTLKQ